MSSYQITWKGFTIDTNYHNVYNPGLPGAQIDQNTNPWSILGQPISDFKAPPPEPPPASAGGYWFPHNISINAAGDLQFEMTNNGPYYYNNQGVKEIVWTSTEAVFTDVLSFGVYCIVAEVLSHTGSLDPWPSFIADFNTIFGMFTYQKNGDSGSNPNHELDITEVGKITNPNTPGDAQFVAQPYNDKSGNLLRYSLNMADIKSGGNQVTFWMNWQGENKDVIFAAQPGAHASVTMPTSAPVNWKMSNTAYSPSIGSAQLHINLWVDGGPVDSQPKIVAVKYLGIPGKVSNPITELVP